MIARANHAASAALIPDDYAPAISLLVCEVDQMRLAIRARLVARITRVGATDIVTGGPAPGRMYVHPGAGGAPVIDLRAALGLTPRAMHPDQQLVLVQVGARQVALRVDRVTDLLAVPESAALARPVAAGCSQLSDGLFVIHDLPRFLVTFETRVSDPPPAATTT